MHIQQLRLKTHQPIADMALFYEKFLECSVLQQDENELELAIGSSKLIFEHDTSQEFRYHFAINIPHNQFEEATAWLAAKLPLMTNDVGTTTFYSEPWNASLVYFQDVAGNILELIARHTYDNPKDTPFSAQSLENISEIGIAVPDVLAAIEEIQNHAPLPVYKGLENIGLYKSNAKETTFVALGDEEGLLILVKAGRLWFPSNQIAAHSLPTALTFCHDGTSVDLAF